MADKTKQRKLAKVLLPAGAGAEIDANSAFQSSQILFCEIRIVGLTTQFYQGFDKSEAFFFCLIAVHLFTRVWENEGKCECFKGSKSH